MIKIIILGGGFGGIRVALDLEKKIGDETKITLIDRNSYHLFVPALYEVASAYVVKKDPFAVRLKKTICVPYSDIFEGKKANFMQAKVSAIDTENKKIVTEGGEILDYDYLVIALGNQVADFGVSGVKEYAFKFKDLEDALLLNRKIDELIKEVAAGIRSRPINMVVVGAGFTGIEVAAEFAHYIKKLSKTLGIKGRCERIMVLQSGPKILPSISNSERISILKRLTMLGVEVVTGAEAEKVGGDYIKLKNGKCLNVDVVIWATGICLPDILVKTSAFPLTENKKIKVNNNLEISALSGVFAVGDNIEFIDTKTDKPVPALAYIAADHGKIVAKNILRLINNKKLVEYKPFYSVWIAPVGGKYAIAHIWGFKISGLSGWIIREIVDLKYMLSILPFKKAVLIICQEINLFTKND